MEVIDLVRGFAILGILPMNIFMFAYTSMEPAEARSVVGILSFIAGEGVMRALFCFGFGLGMAVFLSRNESSNLYFRRIALLFVFGAINIYVLAWPGDILMAYSFNGLILFFFRNRSNRTLIMTATTGTAITAIILGSAGILLWYLGTLYPSLQEEYFTFLEDDPSDYFLRSGSYVENIRWSASYLTPIEGLFRLFDTFWLMLFGFVGGRLLGGLPKISNRQFILVAVIGFAIGLPLKTIDITLINSARFGIVAELLKYFIYDLARISVGLGYVSAFIVLWRYFGFGQFLIAVGKMSLTNYLLQSVVCLFLFAGFGLGLHDSLPANELFLIVLGITVLQVVTSNAWLKIFALGPVEWLWRLGVYLERPRVFRN